MLKLEKPLEAYGFELVVPDPGSVELDQPPPGLAPAPDGPEDPQLSFELTPPPPRLRAVRRHPSM